MEKPIAFNQTGFYQLQQKAIYLKVDHMPMDAISTASGNIHEYRGENEAEMWKNESVKKHAIIHNALRYAVNEMGHELVFPEEISENHQQLKAYTADHAAKVQKIMAIHTELYKGSVETVGYPHYEKLKENVLKAPNLDVWDKRKCENYDAEITGINDTCKPLVKKIVGYFENAKEITLKSGEKIPNIYMQRQKIHGATWLYFSKWTYLGILNTTKMPSIISESTKAALSTVHSIFENFCDAVDTHAAKEWWGTSLDKICTKKNDQADKEILRMKLGKMDVEKKHRLGQCPFRHGPQ